MSKFDIKEVRALAPRLLHMPFKQLWYDYDETADVLYINFKEKTNSDDAKITADDIIVHYEKGKIVGLTLLHASKRKLAKGNKFSAKSSLKSHRLKAH